MLATSALALLLAASTSSLPQSGQPGPSLRGELVLSRDLGLEDRWLYTTRAHEVHALAVERVHRKQVFGVYLFVAGYELDEPGLADLRYDLSITRPDGSPFCAFTELVGHQGPAGDSTAVLLCQQTIFAAFEQEDPFGDYSVSVEIHDRISGASRSLVSALTLAAYVEGPEIESQDAALRALYGPSGLPVVESVIPAFLTLIRGQEWDTDGVRRGAARAIFESNHWLLEKLLDRYADQDELTRRQILWLLARSSFEGDTTDVRVRDPKLWDEVITNVHDPLTDAIQGRDDVNELWGMYTVAHRLEPFLRLCLALSPETGVVASEVVGAQEFEVDVPLPQVVLRVVRSLLEADSTRDPFSREYGLFLASNEGVPQAVRAALTRIYGD